MLSRVGEQTKSDFGRSALYLGVALDTTSEGPNSLFFQIVTVFVRILTKRGDDVQISFQFIAKGDSPFRFVDCPLLASRRVESKTTPGLDYPLQESATLWPNELLLGTKKIAPPESQKPRIDDASCSVAHVGA